ncbi:SET and MYND domain-containing protein 4 [Trichoplax sp. H2]|nr:SET and MYND domain-containing protein 4 [Trichoplax sp. H2]|eukprot:RDD37824.1 SET and MYND domain-containing protein 4 [Trichoplax sp. H2]
MLKLDELIQNITQDSDYSRLTLERDKIEYILAKLRDNDSILKWKDKYEKCIKEEHTQRPSISDCRCKNREESERYRLEGNKHFQSKEDHLALYWYNKSICFAPNPSTTSLLALALANRSAVFFKLQKFKECSQDIESALELGYPSELRSKLDKRKSLCNTKLHQNPLTQSSLSSTATPFRSDKLRVHYSKEAGRSYKAANIISKGEIVMIEAPYASILNSKWHYLHCDYCYEEIVAVTPCPLCSSGCYCSSLCRDKAWRLYHWIECHSFEILQQVDDGTRLSLRILLSSSRSEILDICCHKIRAKPHEWLTKGLHKLTDESCFLSFMFSQRIIRWIQDLNVSTDDKILKNDQYQPAFKNLNNIDIALMLVSHIQQLRTNVHAITKLVTISKWRKVVCPEYNDLHHVSQNRQERIALALYLNSSLFNHSCNPNTIVSFTGRDITFKATCNIAKDVDVTHCYGPHINHMTRKERIDVLLKQYYFTCSCDACQSDSNLSNAELYGNALKCKKCDGPVKQTDKDEAFYRCQNCQWLIDSTEVLRKISRCNRLFLRAQKLSEDGNIQAGIATMKECLSDRLQLLHKFNLDLSFTYDSLAKLYAEIGNWKSASTACHKSVKTVQFIYGNNSIEYANELHKLALLYFNGKQINEALATINAAIALFDLHYGSSNTTRKELDDMKCFLLNCL